MFFVYINIWLVVIDRVLAPPLLDKNLRKICISNMWAQKKPRILRVKYKSIVWSQRTFFSLDSYKNLPPPLFGSVWKLGPTPLFDTFPCIWFMSSEQYFTIDEVSKHCSHWIMYSSTKLSYINSNPVQARYTRYNIIVRDRSVVFFGHSGFLH